MTLTRGLAALACAVTVGALAPNLVHESRAQEKPAAKKTPRGLAGAGLTQTQVDAAVQKGVAYLIGVLDKDKEEGQDTYAATTNDGVLVAYALAAANAFEKRPDLGKKFVEELYRRPIGSTYPTATTILALEHLGGRIHAERIGDCVQALLDQQGPEDSGGWNYGNELESAPERKVPAAAPAGIIEVTGGLPLVGAKTLASLAKKGEAGSDGDNSTTQFATLGIHAATTIGIDVPKDVWTRLLKHVDAFQSEDGGFGYGGPGDSYGSMTCAGISILAMALHHSGVKQPLEDPRMTRALAWLEKRFSFETNPGTENMSHFYYYVYGIERVGVLLGLDFLGDHEWYPEGCKFLLSKQGEDGAWSKVEATEAEVQATCFALLFLTKATRPIAAPKGGSGTLRTAVRGDLAAGPKDEGLYVILDASGSMQEKLGGKTKWEIVREGAKRLVAKLPDGALFALRVYGHNPSNPKKVDERETELLMPLAKLDRAKFNQIVDAIKPIGRTPIAMSFDRCGTDLASGAPCRVLLLSDGAETGGGDPVAQAKALAANPKCKGIDCLGFDLAAEPKARQQLQEIAKAGKGRYTETEDPEVLGRAGARAGAEYVLVDAKGAEVAHGTLGDARPLPEGEYRIKVTVKDKPYEADVWINTAVETTATVHAERAK